MEYSLSYLNLVNQLLHPVAIDDHVKGGTHTCAEVPHVIEVVLSKKIVFRLILHLWAWIWHSMSGWCHAYPGPYEGPIT